MTVKLSCACGETEHVIASAVIATGWRERSYRCDHCAAKDARQEAPLDPELVALQPEPVRGELARAFAA